MALRVGLMNSYKYNEYEIRKILQRKMCSPVEWVEEEIWHTKDGNIDSLVESKEVDMIGTTTFTYTEERAELVPFSYFSSFQKAVFDVPSPRLVEEDSMEWLLPLRSLTVFTGGMWAAVLITLLALLVFNGVCRVLKDSQIGPWKWLAHFTGQNTRSEANGTSVTVKWLLILTSILTVHFLVLYQNCLLGQLIITNTFKSPIESVDDVARLVASKQAKVDFLSASRGGFINRILEGTPELQRALAVNPPIYSHDESNKPELVNNKFVIKVSTEENFLKYFERKACNRTMVPSSLTVLSAYPLSPNISTTHRNCLDEAIKLHLQEIIAERFTVIDRHRGYYEMCRQEVFRVGIFWYMKM